MEKEIRLLDYQNIISIIFIGTVIISILLTNDEKSKLLNKPTLFKDSVEAINLINKIVVVVLTILIIYVNYCDYKIGKEKGSNLNPLRHQIEASVLNSLAALFVLYIIFENRDFNIVSIQNPTV